MVVFPVELCEKKVIRILLMIIREEVGDLFNRIL